MNVHKTKIEWATHTWNPVTGCFHGCPYCYARSITRRFEPHAVERPMNPDAITGEKDFPGLAIVKEPVRLMDERGVYSRSTPYPCGFRPTFNDYTLDYPEKRLIPSRIFVSSMGDLFGEWIPTEWIMAVFEACKKAPRHTYLFLTKTPVRYCILDEITGALPIENNYWYGATATDADQMSDACEAFWALSGEAKTFLSIEPLMCDITKTPAWNRYMFPAVSMDRLCVDWIIIGAMTGPGASKNRPRREWVENIVFDAHTLHIPVFMKDSLAPVWGKDLIREFPADMPKAENGKKLVPRCRECEHVGAVQQGKRGTSYTCEKLGKHIPGTQSNRSPLWCPKREGVQ
jgi:protein gp37